MSDFTDGIFYTFHTTTLNNGKSYIDSSGWTKNKGPTINPKYDDPDVFRIQ